MPPARGDATLVRQVISACVPTARTLHTASIAARLPGSDASVNRLDSMLDPARSGAANSSRVLFQVDAAEVGYLKMMAMVDFENGQWEADELMFNWRPNS